MTDYTALKAELQRYAPLVPLCADALAAIEELERDAKRWRSSAAPAPEPVAWQTEGGYIDRDKMFLLRNGFTESDLTPLYAAPQQSAPAQPVAWRYLYHDPHGSDMRIWHNSSHWNGMTPIESQPLYAAPQPAQAEEEQCGSAKSLS